MSEAIIYVLRCPETNAVRYVGKCIDLKTRVRQHISESRIGKVKSHKCTWIASLLRKGLKPKIEIDCVVDDGDDWKAVEQARVAFHRANGWDLTNGTDGGDSPGELTVEGRIILSKRASAQFGTAEGRRRQSEAMRALCADPEFVSARDRAAKATRATPEYKAAASARQKANWQNPAFRAKLIAARRELSANADFRQRLSASAKLAKSDPERRQRAAEKARAAWADPEIRARQTAAIKRAADRSRGVV